MDMETQNVTLSVRKDLLKKVKHIAVERNTSLSGLLNTYLEKIAGEDEEYVKAMQHMIREMEQGYEIGYSKNKVSRDELHERR
jgi:hypothetical protein